MANHPHLAGLVLARGGSTGIPLKNLATLGDKSILEWALTAMNDNLCPFDSVWVSTDHDKIASCAENCQVSVFRRSPEFATADAPSIAAVQEFLEHHPEVDIVGLVQCTSPFVQPKFLEQAYSLMIQGDYDAVFSVTRSKKFRWSETKGHAKSTRALNFDPADRPRRQGTI